MSVRLVSKNSEAEIKRKETLVNIKAALRELTANLIRIVRGAGKSYEIAEQINTCLAAFLAYQDACGSLPPALELDKMLEMRRKSQDILGTPDEKARQRWLSDGSFDLAAAEDQIRAGVLRTIAAELVGPRVQEANGEKEMHEGLRMYLEFREERRARRCNSSQAGHEGTARWSAQESDPN